jgi:uncharacterized protein (DUF1697 family)
MRYIALLRGVNVGGNTMIKMAELKASFESLGFQNVVTYVNSGNIAFDAKKTGEASIVAKIEKVIEKDCGKMIPVMLRAQDLIPSIIENNPFAGKFESHKEMHVLFLREEMTAGDLERLKADSYPGEGYEAIGRELYCHLPLGVIESLLGKSYIEKKLKLAVTGRNWRTVEKLAVL